MTDLADTPLYLTNLARLNISPKSEDVERLADYLEFRTVASAKTDPDRQLAPTVHLGYLSMTLQSCQVFVPFHLASVFPPRQKLTYVLDVARSAALIPTNPICVSGSTTFLRRMHEMGDLDFCEYHLTDPNLLPSALRTKMNTNFRMPLVEIKCGDERFHPPWSETLSHQASQAIHKDTSLEVPARKIKLDMVSDGPLGLLPTTSVVLTLGMDREGGNARESFAFQEAVVSLDAPPRVLHDAETFAQYCGWLLGQAKALVTGSSTGKPATVRAPKALKRLLSLLLILEDNDIVEEVLEGLDVPELRYMVRSGRVLELAAMIDKVEMGHRPRLEEGLRELREMLDAGGFDDEKVNEVAEIALEIADSVIRQLERRMGSIGSPA